MYFSEYRGDTLEPDISVTTKSTHAAVADSQMPEVRGVQSRSAICIESQLHQTIAIGWDTPGKPVLHHPQAKIHCTPAQTAQAPATMLQPRQSAS